MKTPRYIPVWFRDLTEERMHEYYRKIGRRVAVTMKQNQAFHRFCWNLYQGGVLVGLESKEK